MGAKDITEKTLEAYNDVFADIINVMLFLVLKTKQKRIHTWLQESLVMMVLLTDHSF